MSPWNYPSGGLLRPWARRWIPAWAFPSPCRRRARSRRRPPDGYARRVCRVKPRRLRRGGHRGGTRTEAPGGHGGRETAAQLDQARVETGDVIGGGIARVGIEQQMQQRGVSVIDLGLHALLLFHPSCDLVIDDDTRGRALQPVEQAQPSFRIGCAVRFGFVL